MQAPSQNYFHEDQPQTRRRRNGAARRTTLLALIACLALPAVRCEGSGDGAPLLAFLFNSRLALILKGTYATDRPLEFSQINNNRLFIDDDDSILNATTLRFPDASGCRPFIDPDCVPNYNQLPMYLDIGEVRVSSQGFLNDELSGIDTSQASQEFWDVVAAERQVYCSQPYAQDFDTDSCFDTGGLINYQEFMNGRGALYPSTDIAAGAYYHAGIYVRGIVTGWGLTSGVISQDDFDNNDILGTNITPYVQYDPNVDEVSQQLLPPDWFPLHYSAEFGMETLMVKDFSYNAIVLEVRSNIKENLMLHSFVNNQGENQIAVSFSDWRRGHTDQTSDRGLNQGGNVLTRGRMFYPDYTSTLTIDGGTASTRHYYALYVSNAENKNEHLPYAATPVRQGSDNTLENIMPAPYVLQCRYDCRHDGYPEAVLSQSEEFIVGQGPGIVLRSLPCGSPPPADLGCD